VDFSYTASLNADEYLLQVMCMVRNENAVHAIE